MTKRKNSVDSLIDAAQARAAKALLKKKLEEEMSNQLGDLAQRLVAKWIKNNIDDLEKLLNTPKMKKQVLARARKNLSKQRIEIYID